MKRLFVILLALLMLPVGCTSAPEEQEKGTVVPVYFLAPAGTASGGDALVCSEEWFDLHEAAPMEDLARAIAERVLSGSRDGRLPSPFPEEARLNSLYIRGTRVQVDLTGISRMDGISLTLADYCLTLSLTAVDGIESVSITCDGRLLAQQPRRVFQPHDVLLSTGDSVLQQLEVVLYFVDSEGVLTPENRVLDIYEGETQSEVLLAALLSGPKDSRLSGVIPEEFSVISVKVEDGICRINIPRHVLDALPEDETTQHLILWSLAESLYSLSYIDEIRLMVDGAELERFGQIPVESIAKRPQG